MSKLNKELKGLSEADLNLKLDTLQRDLFGLRLHSKTNPVKNNAQFKRLRHDIARVLTVLNQMKAR